MQQNDVEFADSMYGIKLTRFISEKSKFHERSRDGGVNLIPLSISYQNFKGKRIKSTKTSLWKALIH